MSTRRVNTFIVAFFLAFAASATTPSTRSGDANRLYVSAVAGNVSVTMAGAKSEVRFDSTVSLPARIVTGNDGMLGLTQALTTITVAADTDVEIPAEAADGQLIARLIQHRGNVFYDVAHREVGRFRVETPFLVAVIKGTQFNVAVQENSTTISLFEGLLEIRTPDGDDVVELNAGEIAIRSRVDGSIRVIGMDEERLETPQAADRAAADDTLAAQRVDEEVAGLVDTVLGAGVAGTANLPADANLTLGAGAPTADLGLDLGKGTGLDTGAQVDLGLGSGTASAGVDLGVGAANLGLDTGVDLGAAGVAVGLDAGVDLGAGSVDVGLDTGVDLGAGSVDVGLDTGLGLGLDLGLDFGGDNPIIDLDLDLGGDTDSDPVDDAPPPPPDDGLLGGLLGGLL